MVVRGERTLLFGFLVLIFFWDGVKSQCSAKGCDALASYYAWDEANLTLVSTAFSTSINNITSYNPQITNPDFVVNGTRLNVPFSCGYINKEFMGNQFSYQVRPNETYHLIAELIYSNLTTVEMMMRFNSYAPESISVSASLDVVNCSCGTSRVSRDYGLVVTYALRPGQSLSGIASEVGLPERLLQDYKLGVDFGSGSGLVFIPGRDKNGTYPPLRLSSSGGISGGAIAGISIADVVAAASLAVGFYVFYRSKRGKKEPILSDSQSIGSDKMETTSESGLLVIDGSPKLKGITVDKSMEFTYEELADATDGFSLSYKIGQGGFGSVYYAELRGEKTAIKKMDMQASKEFLAELKVLTHVHHVNLVRLIGYCVEGSLFLVYE